MAELLAAEDFLPHVDKVFRVQGGRHALTLTRIDQRRLDERELGDRDPFNLLFRGPAGDLLPEGLYPLEVDGGPAFELYLIPIHTPERDRQNYQSPFN